MADRTCSVAGCERPPYARTWCSKHYQRWQAYGDPTALAPKRPTRLCTVEGCSQPHLARGWCASHYQRWRTCGDPVSVFTPKNSGPCSVDGCDRPARTRGYCVMHHSRLLTRGDVGGPEPEAAPGRVCSIDGCLRPHLSRGWCTHHYERWRQYGDPLAQPVYRNTGKTCSEPGCDRQAVSLGLCHTHYQRVIRKGTAQEQRPWLLCPAGHGWCGTCNTYLPLDRFYASFRPGRSGICRACGSARSARWRHRNPGKGKGDPEKARRWRKSNRPRLNAHNRKRQAIKRSVKSEFYTSVEIAERDGWRCGICGKRISKTIRWPDPKCLTIDHIIPYSRGGHDLKVNVQAAHFGCNCSKRNRGTDQLRLFG